MTMTTEQSAASDDRWVADVEDTRGRGIDSIPFRFDGDHDGAMQHAKDRFEDGIDEVVMVHTLDGWFELYSSEQETGDDE